MNKKNNLSYIIYLEKGKIKQVFQKTVDNAQNVDNQDVAYANLKKVKTEMRKNDTIAGIFALVLQVVNFVEVNILSFFLRFIYKYIKIGRGIFSGREW